ncbi:kinase [Actinoplanes italicus]|uniref:Sugar/nucleoside kinase (Ribokinase family) n=1 Tax=Actinoplanes italicus TaxID=113567 RepID=A0A2T0K7B4_9ACTN|nr:PfkB family carbohydrate kinase [Actinoplanes italicus]PRX18913.1 sugar/nucleoside kinase (ribokinase family) [Actinoplanes italicus]GIE32509.1 kinase [Actinoplanes italicus]
MTARRRRLLFVGLATVDLVQRVQRLPGTDEKVQSDSVDVAAGGPAANAAVTAAALGASLEAALGPGHGFEITLVSAVGAHPLGDLIRADLAAHGVTLIDATPDAPDPPPVSAVTVLASTGERTIVSRNAGDRTVNPPPEGLPDADLTLVDGHHPALASAAARSAKRLLVDAGSWRPIFADIFPNADVVACSGDFRHPSAEPARPTTGAPAPDQARRDAATASAIAAPHVVITHGAAPVRWFSASRPERTAQAAPTRPPRAGEVTVPHVTAVDTAGAGDAFHGALAVALVQGDRDLPAAIAYASEIAAIRVSHAGPRAWLSHLP